MKSTRDGHVTEATQRRPDTVGQMHTMDGHKERKHKSKKRDRHGDPDDKRKHKKRKEKEAVIRVVDDDLNEDMWVEKNIDMDGEKARKVHIFKMSFV